MEHDKLLKNEKITLKPHLIIIRGVPGSGKTSLASEMCIKFDSKALVVLDPDTIKKESPEYVLFVNSLKFNDSTITENVYPYRYLLNQAKEALRLGKSIIWDQPFTHIDGLKYTISILTNFAKDLGMDLPLLVIELQTSKEISIKRIHDRKSNGGHGLTIEQIDDFFKKYSTAEDSGYRTLKFDTSNINLSGLVDEVISNLY